MSQNSDRANRRATLTQVATLAGVSTATASLVLGGKASQVRISRATRLRVLDAAQQLDYTPNLLVQSMQSGRTGVLSFFNAFRHRVRNDLYMDRFSTSVELAAGKAGYDVLVHCDFSRPPRDTYNVLNGGRADGVLLFAPAPDDPLLPLLRSSRLPVVLIGARDPEGVLPWVRDDVASGMRQVVDALIANGHRRIAGLIEEGSDFRDAHERIALLRRLLGERGIEVPDSRIVVGRGDWRGLLQDLLGQEDPPTAIFCWRDFAAYRVLDACAALGVEAPRQLSVIGYDGLHWPAATHHVAASVRVDLEALAAAAITLLDEHIRGEESAARERWLPVTFQTGTTLGPAWHRH